MSLILKKFPAQKVDKLRARILHYYDFLSMKHDARQEDKSFVGYLIGLIDYPFNYLRLYTIPPGDEEEYNHHYTVYWPFLGIPAILFIATGMPNIYWLLAIPF